MKVAEVVEVQEQLVVIAVQMQLVVLAAQVLHQRLLEHL
jgi:hypothetical protein